MPKDESTAGREEARAVLRAIHAGLGQPPLGDQLRATIVRCLDLLAEQDLERRFAVRERIGEWLAERGEQPAPTDRELDPPLITRPHDWPHEQ
jgi:hypothetical protein